MNLNPIKAIINVYRNVKLALTDPNSRLNLIGLEPELRELEQRIATNSKHTPMQLK